MYRRQFDQSPLRRVIAGFGANAFGQVVTIVVQLIGVPVLLMCWGSQVYGEWLTLFAVPAFLAMTDLGFSQSAANDMSLKVAAGDKRGALAVFQSLSLLVFLASGIALIASLLLILLLPVDRWLELKALNSDSAKGVLLFLAMQVVTRLTNGVAHAGFRAAGRYPLHVLIDGATRLLQFSSVWIVALSGGAPLGAAAAYLCVSLLGTCFSLGLLLRQERWLRIGTDGASSDELRRLFKPALANISMPLAQAINIQGMVLVVANLLGPIAVVAFSTIRTLTRLAVQLVLAIGDSAEPEIARARGLADSSLMQRLFMHTQRIAVWLSLGAVGLLAIFGRQVVEIWTRGEVEVDSYLFAFLLIAAVVNASWYGAMVVLKAVNQHLRASVVFACLSLAAVLVAWIAMREMRALYLAGLSLLFLDAGMVVCTFVLAAEVLRMNLAKAFVQAMNPLPLFDLAIRQRRHA